MIRLLTEMSLARSYKQPGVQTKDKLLLEYVNWCLRYKDNYFIIPIVFAFDSDNGTKRYFISNDRLANFIKDSETYDRVIIKITRMNKWIIRLRNELYDALSVEEKENIVEKSSEKYRRYVIDINDSINDLNKSIDHLYNDIVKFNLENSDVKPRSSNGSGRYDLEIYKLPTETLYKCEIVGTKIVSTNETINIHSNTVVSSYTYYSIIDMIKVSLLDTLRSKYVSIEKIWNERFTLKVSDYVKELFKNVSLN